MNMFCLQLSHVYHNDCRRRPEVHEACASGTLNTEAPHPSVRVRIELLPELTIREIPEEANWPFQPEL